MACCKLILFSLLFALVSSEGQNPIVRVSHGVLQGAWKQSTNGRTYASFQGIPYARPPVGKYRFREPQLLKPWPGVWDASRPLSDCLQYDPFSDGITGNEDCLFLNVYTPKLNPEESLPVVIFIHGGAFMFGSGTLYDPSHLMDRDMVIVTMNYRLGPLGFLSTGDDAAPGNAGLKDQALALKWVRNNIKFFGGNPESVTLTGCSAGGASVHYHYLSPLSKGTFDRGIAFSGSALSSWAHAAKPATKARSLAAIVGCPTANTREMVDCLRSRPGQVIVSAQIEMYDWKLHLLTPFTPTTEPKGTRQPFFTEYPYHTVQAGAMLNLPLIASVNSEEGLYPAAAFLADPDILLDLEARWEHLASNIFNYNDTLPLDMRSVVANKIKEEYLGGKPVGQETFLDLVQAIGDRLFMGSVSKMAQLHALKSGQPTYFYQYSYRGTHSLSNLLAQNDENYGTSHADDVLFIFKFFPFTDYSPEDIRMRDAMMDMIYSYASTGVPKFPNAPVWAEVKPGAKDLDYLDIVSPNNIGMKSSSDFGKKSFWDSLGFLENDNYNVNIRDEL